MGCGQKYNGIVSYYDGFQREISHRKRSDFPRITAEYPVLHWQQLKNKNNGNTHIQKGYFFTPWVYEKDIQPIQELHINQEDSFQVIPFDSNVRFQPDSSNEIFGPFR